MGQKPSSPVPGTTLQVIGAGLPRTGTASFSEALEILLQGPTLHGGTQCTLGPPSHIKRWIKILQLWVSGVEANHPQILQELGTQLSGYAAITDTPGCQFVPELLKLYPDAKVICTVRETESWVKSMDQIANKSLLWFLRGVLLPLPGMRNFPTYIHLLTIQWPMIYGELHPTPKTYDRHMAWLKEIVPEDRLVFFDVKDGWEPLCKALGKEIPAQPFPHVNDSDAIEQVASYHIKRGLTRWAVIIGALGAAVWALRR